jgi:hypothetical protein
MGRAIKRGGEAMIKVVTPALIVALAEGTPSSVGLTS